MMRQSLRFFSFSSLMRNCSETNGTTVQDTIITNKIGSTVTIGINRPEKRNCLNIATAKQLLQEVKNFEDDDSANVAVIYGVGGNFCAGFDIDEISKLKQSPLTLFSEDGCMGPTRRIPKKPIVAGISGYAVGGGLELALMCDLRVVEETAILGFYNRRFGIPLTNGGTVRLQAMVGLSRAMDLVLTGRSLTGKEAHDWGLVSRLVACGTGYGQAVHLAASIDKFPQKCILADRKSTYYSCYNAKSIEDAFNFEKQTWDGEIFHESVDGAKKFLSGLGKHGKFQQITERPVKEWEK